MFERITVNKTSLYQSHKKLNAKLIPFSGYEMPVSYGPISDEYRAIRTQCGIFDVSHMGQFRITGIDAKNFINVLTINNIEKIDNYEAQYSAMCNEGGGLIDDLILFKFSTQEYIIIVNASNKSKVLEWMLLHKNKFTINIEDMNKDNSLIALQGPSSIDILNKISDNNIDLSFYHLMIVKLLDYEVILSRTGYTGELGFEILAKHSIIVKLWEYFINQGVNPCGLAVRDVLRMEMKYCLYGNDINESINPLEAGLSWITDLNKQYFIGRQKLLELKNKGYSKKLVGFIMNDKAIPRKGYIIYCNEEKIGEVTSGTHSPTLSKGIGLAYIKLGHNKIGQKIHIEIRGKLMSAEIIKTPFINNTSLYNQLIT